MPATKADIERWAKQVKDEGFAAFADRRSTYNQVVHRQLPPLIDAHLAVPVASYQTPDVWEEELTYCDILTMGPVRFDSVPGKVGADADKDANTHRLWHARLQALLDPDGRWRRQQAQGIFRHGVKVSRLLEREYKDYVDAGADDYSVGADLWALSDVDTLACGWLLREGHIEVFVHEYELPVVYADLQVRGEKLGEGFDRRKRYVCIADKFTASGLGWVGEDVAQGGERSGSGETLTVLCCEYRDYDKPCPVCPDHHPLYSGVEIVRGAGKSISDGDVINEYTLPWKHWPSYRLTAGRLSDLDREPHFRYPPAGLPLMAEAQIINWCTTVLQTMASRDITDPRVFYELSGSLPDGVGFSDGFAEKWAVPLPDVADGEAAVVPGKLARWPADLAPTLEKYIELAMQRFEAKKINRFLLGNPSPSEPQRTGSEALSNVQQGRIPFEWPLKQIDATILDIHRDVDHAIRYRDYESARGEEAKYTLALTGNEADNLKRGGSTAGEALYLSASKLASNPLLVLETDNQTLAEQAERLRQALVLKQAGLINDEQCVEMAGYTDTESQMRRIEKARLRRLMQPTKDTVIQNAAQVMLTTLTEVSPQMLIPGGMQPQPPPAPEGNGAPPAPNVRLPALSRPGSQPQAAGR